jgi:hypothetical protein
MARTALELSKPQFSRRDFELMAVESCSLLAIAVTRAPKHGNY